MKCPRLSPSRVGGSRPPCLVHNLLIIEWMREGVKNISHGDCHAKILWRCWVCPKPEMPWQIWKSKPKFRSSSTALNNFPSERNRKCWGDLQPSTKASCTNQYKAFCHEWETAILIESPDFHGLAFGSISKQKHGENVWQASALLPWTDKWDCSGALGLMGTPRGSR